MLIDDKVCFLCPKYLALTNKKKKESANISGKDSNRQPFSKRFAMIIQELRVHKSMRKKVQTAKQSLFFKYQSFQKDTPIKTKKKSKTFLHPLSGNVNEIIIIITMIIIID